MWGEEDAEDDVAMLGPSLSSSASFSINKEAMSFPVKAWLGSELNV